MKGILVAVLLFGLFILVGCSHNKGKPMATSPKPTESSSLRNRIIDKVGTSAPPFYLPAFVPQGEKALSIQYNKAIDTLSISFNNMTIFEGGRPQLLKVNNNLAPGKTFNISNGMFCQWLHNNATTAILMNIGQSPTHVLISSKTFGRPTLLKVASSLEMVGERNYQ